LVIATVTLPSHQMPFIRPLSNIISAVLSVTATTIRDN